MPELLEITTATEGKIKGYYDPDYSTKCDVCGGTPCVRIRRKNGSVFYEAGMCGTCTWGEADASDPANW